MKVTDVRAVIAIGLRGQFGLRGRLPWEGNRGREYVADVERFFELTRGHVVIMGQRTFTSVPDFAFKNRDIFADFLRAHFDGITYIDTIFLKPAQSENENVYFMNLFTLFNGACSDQIAFCWRTRMAWNALAIGRVRWKLWRMMQNQSSLALRLFSTQKSWSRTNSACKAATLLRHQN